MTDITVVIPHASSTETLIAVLTQLQMQTQLPAHIYIIDCSENKSGLRIAQKFCFNNVPMKVEVKKGTIYENWNAGIELSQQDHPDASILIINDDVLLPLDALEQFSRNTGPDDLCLVPETPPRTHAKNYVTTIFQHKSRVWRTEKTNWMSGFVFLLTKKCLNDLGVFDTRYKVWFGDTEYERRINRAGGIKIIRGLYVYHFGSRSYKYQSKEVLDQIDKDRKLYNA